MIILLSLLVLGTAVGVCLILQELGRRIAIHYHAWQVRRLLRRVTRPMPTDNAEDAQDNAEMRELADRLMAAVKEEHPL